MQKLELDCEKDAVFSGSNDKIEQVALKSEKAIRAVGFFRAAKQVQVGGDNTCLSTKSLLALECKNLERLHWVRSTSSTQTLPELNQELSEDLLQVDLHLRPKLLVLELGS